MRDEARRIAANIAKLPELLRHQRPSWLVTLVLSAGGGAAAIWFNNRNWRMRLAEFEECQTFLNEGRAYTLYRMPTREEKPRSFPAVPRPADAKPDANASHEERSQ